MNENQIYYVIPGVILSEQPVNMNGTPVKVVGKGNAFDLFNANSGDILENKQQGTFFAVSGKKVSKFPTREKAESWLKKTNYEEEPGNIAYCDGSYDPKTGRIGSGMVFIEGSSSNRTNAKIEKSWQVPYSSLQNVSGELSAALEAAKTAYNEGCSSLTIYHDFDGVSEFVDYKGKNKEILNYAKSINEYKNKLSISFVKVKSHKGDVLNGRADILAKSAIGK